MVLAFLLLGGCTLMGWALLGPSPTLVSEDKRFGVLAWGLGCWDGVWDAGMSIQAG